MTNVSPQLEKKRCRPSIVRTVSIVVTADGHNSAAQLPFELYPVNSLLGCFGPVLAVGEGHFQNRHAFNSICLPR